MIEKVKEEPSRTTTCITIAYKYLASVTESIKAMPSLGVEYLGHSLNGINKTCQVNITYTDPLGLFYIGYLARAEDVVDTLRLIEERNAEQ